ncbi:MAG: LacI family DNA-binding transcriptional regulator [Lachnospiraceae bacterium]|nr:LacI family DNA-binding transcriptional regulator [Lachnospiraceae bacterium]
MKKTTVEGIAKKLNVSVSMVSRVLRHCSGVDSEMRLRILEEAGDLPLRDFGECPVYVILPDTPRYFWGEMRRGVFETLHAEGLRFKDNLCTKVHDEAAILNYLEEAVRLDSHVLLLAVRTTPAIRNRLQELVPDRFVLFLSEYSDLANTFYCGADPFEEGYRIGREFVSRDMDRRLIVFSLPDRANYEERLAGFLKAVSDEDPEVARSAVNVPLSRKILSNFKLIPSAIAPLLEKAARYADRIAVYSPSGIPGLPLAFSKTRLTEKAVLYCQDCSVKDFETLPIVSLDQDCYLQGETAALLAADFLKHSQFPSEKKTFIPSRIHFYPEN